MTPLNKTATPQQALILLSFLHFSIRNTPARCCGFNSTENIGFAGIVAVLRIFPPGVGTSSIRREELMPNEC